ncbi:hypothetical protein DL96DRAFT_1575881 [Flagelloscypha sp. PMI_526]|nr:hypothetical protein DL96DRAFT_1575881 [Flagelloscypha sp. PMI_526]
MPYSGPSLPYNLAIIFLHAFVFGIFIILSILSSTLLVHRHRRERQAGSIFKHPIFVGGILLTCFVTAHWFIHLNRTFEVFRESSPISYYDLSNPQAIAMVGLLAFSAILSDVMIIYRLWTICNYKVSIVILPISSLLLLLVSGVGILYELLRLKPDEDIYKSSLSRWVKTDCAFTLCTNIYCTSFISFQVWQSQQSITKSGGFAPSDLTKNVLPVISESAAIYTLTTILYYVGYLTKSDFQYPALDLWPTMAGISFMLITVRVGMGWEVKNVPVRAVGAAGVRRDSGLEFERHVTAPATTKNRVSTALEFNLPRLSRDVDMDLDESGSRSLEVIEEQKAGRDSIHTNRANDLV